MPFKWKMAFWACVLAVLVLSLAPAGPELPSTGWDKSNHLLAFVVLAMLGLPAYPRHRARLLAALLLYGALIEALQGLTSYRSAEWADWLADGLGVAIGYALSRGLRFARTMGSG